MTLLDKKNCEYCLKTFKPRRSDQRFDNDNCRKKADRTRAKSRPQQSAAPQRSLPDPIARAQNAVVYLTHGLKKIGEELGLPDLVEKAGLAMDEFEEAFNTVDECFDIWERELAKTGDGGTNSTISKYQ